MLNGSEEFTDIYYRCTFKLYSAAAIQKALLEAMLLCASNFKQPLDMKTSTAKLAVVYWLSVALR